MQFGTGQTELALKRDIVYSLCSAMNEDDFPLPGFWTFFNKLVSNVKHVVVVQ